MGTSNRKDVSLMLGDKIAALRKAQVTIVEENMLIE